MKKKNDPVYISRITTSSEDDDDIHKGTIEVGQTLRGSVVVHIKVDVQDTDDQYTVKKNITMLDGVIYQSIYIRTKAQGLSSIDTPGEFSLTPAQLQELKRLNRKSGNDDSEVRAKARAVLEERQRRKSSLLSSGVPKPKPATTKPTMELHVKNSTTGKVITISPVQPNTDTIRHLQQKIQDLEGTLIPHQRLFFNDTPLFDCDDIGTDTDTNTDTTTTSSSKTVAEWKIPNGYLLTLEPRMVIHVKTLEGTILSMTVTPTDTIQDVKNKLASQASGSIPVEDQRLLYQGKELDPKKPTATLTDYGITHGSTLDLAPMQIHVKTLEGTIIPVTVTPTDTIQDVKKKVASQAGIPEEDQRLLYQGKELDQKPTATLTDHGIQHGSTLDLAPMQIHVKTLEGTIIPVTVTPTDTIQDVKNKVASQAGIPVEDQRLLYQGRELDQTPTATLTDHGIMHGSTLDLAPMQIHVKTLEGTIIPVTVQPTDTIHDVKKKVASQAGIPVEDQRLLYQGKELDPKKPTATLTDHGITHGSTLDLAPMQIHVKTLEGTILSVTVHPTDTIHDVKKKVASQAGIPVEDQRLLYQGKDLDQKPTATLTDHGITHGSTLDLAPMQIHVKTLVGTILSVTVQPTDTIHDVKNKVSSQAGIPVEDQRLLYQGKELDQKPTATLTDHGITHGSTLDLAPMQIHVKTPKGATIPIHVIPSDTVHDIKQKVQNETGIPIGDQRLLFGDKELDKDTATLKDCGIQHGSNLNLVDDMTIQVEKLDGKTMNLTVKPSDTIKDVKQKIYDQEGIPIDEQRLSFLGKDLDKDEATLSGCTVKHGSTLKLQPMQIHVKTLDDRLLSITAVPSDTIKTIKKKVEKLGGIPADEQRLVFQGRELDQPFSTVVENGIQHGSTLDLAPLQIQVKTLDGQLVQVTVDLTKDTVKDVKDKVQAKTGIPVNEQRLLLGSKELDKDIATLKACGIQHGTNLDLGEMTIQVETPDGSKTLALAVKPSDTIQNVKKMIQDQEGIPVDEQKLTFGGKALESDKSTLSDCHIKHGSTLQLLPMTIQVRMPNGSLLPLVVKPTDTVKDIKKKVKAKGGGIPVEEQRLLFDGVELLDNKATLRDCKIPDGSILDMADDRMQIKVQTPEGKKTIQLEVKPKDTIESIKKRLQELEGIPVDEQTLALLNGKDVLLNPQTLADCGIQNGSVLQLSTGMKIDVKDWNGKKFTLDVIREDTIAQVKEKIKEKEGHPIHRQFLLFGGTFLDNDKKSLAQCGIQHKSLVNVDRMKIYIKTTTGKFPLTVEPETTLTEIKDMVKKAQNVDPKEQILLFHDVELNDTSKTLADYKVEYKSTLVLEAAEVPEYEVKVGPWQSGFDFVGKDKGQREGKRKKKPLGKEY
jgi:ubiquitin C